MLRCTVCVLSLCECMIKCTDPLSTFKRKYLCCCLHTHFHHIADCLFNYFCSYKSLSDFIQYCFKVHYLDVKEGPLDEAISREGLHLVLKGDRLKKSQFWSLCPGHSLPFFPLSLMFKWPEEEDRRTVFKEMHHHWLLAGATPCKKKVFWPLVINVAMLLLTFNELWIHLMNLDAS